MVLVAVDTFGAEAKMVRSTISKVPAMWLFVKHGRYGKYKGALHLNLEQAETLRNELDHFIQANLRP